MTTNPSLVDRLKAHAHRTWYGHPTRNGRSQGEADLYAEAAARIQALEAGAGEGWRTMDTAPKDGLLRLFWSPLGGCFIAPDIAPSEPTITQKAAMIKAGADWPHVGWNPTAWRPLPAPPSTSAGEGRVAKVAQAFDVGFSLACGLSCGCMDGETPDNYERDEILGLPSPPSGSVGEG